MKTNDDDAFSHRSNTGDAKVQIILHQPTLVVHTNIFARIVFETILDESLISLSVVYEIFVKV